ncbi:hypothetical protein AX13_02650 [Comamonas aquatica DA1877]|uniref:Uncharacterized protein n=1 Tax=Comamonas aquatica DA1877 TaxID=1457173 RepID=A0A014MP19_9BURK|nr:hypothetical protein AX13_02650 [Comamonas aquatica DA1877]
MFYLLDLARSRQHLIQMPFPSCYVFLFSVLAYLSPIENCLDTATHAYGSLCFAMPNWF